MAKSKIKSPGAKAYLYKAYRITSPVHDTKIVFASGIWSAVGVLLQWRYANDIGEVAFAVDPDWASELTGVGREHIDEAQARCRGPGIGVRYRADIGWAIRANGAEPE